MGGYRPEDERDVVADDGSDEGFEKIEHEHSIESDMTDITTTSVTPPRAVPPLHASSFEAQSFVNVGSYLQRTSSITRSPLFFTSSVDGEYITQQQVDEIQRKEREDLDACDAVAKEEVESEPDAALQQHKEVKVEEENEEGEAEHTAEAEEDAERGAEACCPIENLKSLLTDALGAAWGRGHDVLAKLKHHINIPQDLDVVRGMLKSPSRLLLVLLVLLTTPAACYFKLQADRCLNESVKWEALYHEEQLRSQGLEVQLDDANYRETQCSGLLQAFQTEPVHLADPWVMKQQERTPRTLWTHDDAYEDEDTNVYPYGDCDWDSDEEEDACDDWCSDEDDDEWSDDDDDGVCTHEDERAAHVKDSNKRDVNGDGNSSTFECAGDQNVFERLASRVFGAHGSPAEWVLDNCLGPCSAQAIQDVVDCIEGAVPVVRNVIENMHELEGMWSEKLKGMLGQFKGLWDLCHDDDDVDDEHTRRYRQRSFLYDDEVYESKHW